MAHDDAIGHGTIVKRSQDGTINGTFLTVGRVRDVTPPPLSRDTVETTDMESEDRWEEFIGGIKRSGELSFDITFDPGSAETAEFTGDLNNDDPRYYSLTFPDATEWKFKALLTGFEPTVPVADKMAATVTYKLSGKPGFIA
jgi:predicted secreted protein